MKILYCAPFPKKRFFGGISIIAESLKNKTDMFKNFDVELAFFNTEVMDREDKTKGKIKLINLVSFFRLKNKLIKEIKSNDYDCLHVNTSFGIALLKDLLLIKSIKFNKKLVLQIHFCNFVEVFGRRKFFSNLLLSLIEKHVDNVIVLSEKFKKELSVKLKKTKIVTLYNFQDAITDEDAVTTKKDTKIKNLLFLGSIDERKGLLDTIKALKGIDKETYHFYVGGKLYGSDYEKMVKNEISENGMENNVTFLGYVQNEDKIKRLLSSDIFILPSYGEGLPISVIESIAAGLVIISSNVGALDEIIANNVNGFTINPGDIKMLNTYISKCLNDEVLLNKIKNNNRKIADQYCIDTYIENLCKFYKI
ncbi:glycosyltransferase family 4 protein [Petrocella sp. FN5]|uniref:glycosyltransferase family 4 protein n=1 Tax=Petrocella sp. FN5 TaxID=3032002 RepID=UPI0023DA7B6E|nr:glycosyltransferase family 4 protein [Petrocella sp. FN5]MDF1617761.1 glycosyltransferase family 4 protein [Petrocella sp. FN5]